MGEAEAVERGVRARDVMVPNWLRRSTSRGSRLSFPSPKIPGTHLLADHRQLARTPLVQALQGGSRQHTEFRSGSPDGCTAPAMPRQP